MTSRCPICRGSGRITQTTGYYAGCPRCKATGVVWMEDRVSLGQAAGALAAVVVIGMVVLAMLFA